jgi:ABC-type multidrug transport system ATPase subunit
MGSSGAGKTSLLNVLAGRSAPSLDVNITGNVNVAGNDINPVLFKRNIAYVMQDDALMSTATPREALAFSAKLRLPTGVSDETINDLVVALLEELGLVDCADTMIGGAMIKGISGGQMKRTSVGIELITNPSLLFLDEPTSGLDAYNAFQCISLLKRVASHNTAVLCTIHQPSSEVFDLFDLVIFMQAGRILYQGPVKELTNYYAKFGFSCPSNYNPADYCMFVSNQESLQSLDSKKMFMDSTPDDLLSIVKTEKKEWTILEKEAKVAEASFWNQCLLLAEREFQRNVRDKGGLIGRFGVTIFLNLLFGLIFFKVASKDSSNPTNFSSHFGSLTMVLISSMFGAAQPIMLQFPFERPMFLREYSTGTYGTIPYFISKVLLELPLSFAQALCQWILVYFLIGFQGSFIKLVAISFILGLASSSIAIIIGSLVANVKAVTELAPLLFVPQMLFAGFFVRTGQIPAFLRWAQYLCGLKYAMNLALIVEFDPKNDHCQESPIAEAQCEGLLEYNNVKIHSWWVYLLLLLLLFVFFRIVAAFLLVQKAKRFY